MSTLIRLAYHKPQKYAGCKFSLKPHPLWPAHLVDLAHGFKILVKMHFQQEGVSAFHVSSGVLSLLELFPSCGFFLPAVLPAGVIDLSCLL